MRPKRFFTYCASITAGLFLFSCATFNSHPAVIYRVTECPIEIREAALSYARKYVERETAWAWGGRDQLEKEGVLLLDCSGFMVRIFQYAVKGTKYSLLFEDAPLSALYEYFTVPINTLTPGDIIFMGTEQNAPPTHISIFVNADNENIYFMDATLKEEDEINGATLRHYPKDDPRFLSYARLLVKY